LKPAVWVRRLTGGHPRQQGDQEGIGYQTLINRRLRESLETKPLDEETLRRVVREELGAYEP
jgi:hypothetical protein